MIKTSKYEFDEDVFSLARMLALGIIAFLALAIIFSFLGTVLTPGYSLTLEVHGAIQTLAYFLAVLTAIYALLLILSRDESNTMRIIAAFYFVILLGNFLGAI